ncbi:uncharacterized protein N7498_006151 [Penicillium cinerascens]|uniref:Extracellular membrane protein CFEM domain-containing protein n=1 Tax=Penicillium cinerascens TaxID=70096 RepID=A0A9W9MHM7_9EURO|nr:uncharacterized protein N7498_006151 [Penicillium cinerascens]KAJ5201488.1 hypothetical protein N7498_006151 [Penicillium cinerascens]
MLAITLLLPLAQVAMVMAAPASDANTNVARGDSGCYSYANPDCGIDGTYCLCANGNFYLFNHATESCNPPWAYVTNSEASLPGSHC